MKRLHHAITATVLLLLLAGRAAAQDVEGYIDLRANVERQIAQLEQFVGGDQSARKQAVVYHWLIDLYGYLGNLDQVDRCYRSVLSFFPHDIGTLNAYARFLMDDMKDDVRAGEVLKGAVKRSPAYDPRPFDMGTTYQLNAELERRAGRYESAIRFADRAIELLSDERSVDAMRIRAQSLLALERYDDAAEQYLRLIGTNRAVNDDDINALQLFVSKTTRYASGSLRSMIDDAVANARKRSLARVELEGGSVVELTSADGAKLEGTLRRADGPGAVLFVHDTGSRRSVFTPCAQILFVDNISSLAVDLRGHGGSRTDSTLSYETLSPYDRGELVDDVIAAYRYLQRLLGLDESHIAIVAEGSGCALVEKALLEGRIQAPVVYLSPVFLEVDSELNTALGFHADRPTLLISASEDLIAARSIQALPNVDGRHNRVVRTYDDAGHGVETLDRAPGALEYFQDWLRRTVGSG